MTREDAIKILKQTQLDEYRTEALNIAIEALSGKSSELVTERERVYEGKIDNVHGYPTSVRINTYLGQYKDGDKVIVQISKA